MSYKFLGTCILFAGIAMLPLASAKADDWDRETKMSFSAPVAIPGQVLPAGSYVFQLADNPSDRTVVQIFDEDKAHLITTVMAIPAYRLEPTGDSTVTLREEPAGNPEAISRWFFAGDTQGVAFVYPDEQ